MDHTLINMYVNIVNINNHKQRFRKQQSGKGLLRSPGNNSQLNSKGLYSHLKFEIKCEKLHKNHY